MALSKIYLSATVRNVTPRCSQTGAFGVGFNLPGCGPVRLALSAADAQFLAEELAGYIALSTGSQLPMSLLMSSSPKSVPSEGENV